MIPIISNSILCWGHFFDAVARGDALLDLLFINKQAITSHVIINGRVACKDHEMEDFKDTNYP